MRLLIAGGGTGGHLFPAVAIGKEFLKAGNDNEVLFVGTRRGLEKRVLDKEGFRLEYVDVKPLVGKGVLKKLTSVMTLPKSMLQARSIIRSFKPDFALGVGGYSSGPVILCAKMMGIRTGIQEQNIYPGVTNRLLKRFADIVFLAFKEAKMFFEEGKVCITGNPVRQSLFEADAKKAYETLNLDESRFTVMVFGGSLGAESIISALINNLDKLEAVKGEIQIVHQTGEKDFERVREVYDSSNLKSFVAPFIFNMHDAYEVADVIICRAGATTISEVAALKKPAVLVPYPHAAGDHQTKNAENLTQQNMAMMIKDDELDSKLVGIIMELHANRDKLDELRNNIGTIGKSDAAKEIVQKIIEKVTGEASNVS